MNTKRFVASSCLVFAALSSLAYAAGDAAGLNQRICSNLAAASEQVLDDTSTTTKYLSPYIAAEIYQQVVKKSAIPEGVVAPTLASLPCGDTVADFLMAIKKRMEYNRVDHFFARYRVFILGLLLLASIAGGLWLRYRKERLASNDSRARQ